MREGSTSRDRDAIQLPTGTRGGMIRPDWSQNAPGRVARRLEEGPVLHNGHYRTLKNADGGAVWAQAPALASLSDDRGGRERPHSPGASVERRADPPTLPGRYCPPGVGANVQGWADSSTLAPTPRALAFSGSDFDSESPVTHVPASAANSGACAPGARAREDDDAKSQGFGGTASGRPHRNMEAKSQSEGAAHAARALPERAGVAPGASLKPRDRIALAARHAAARGADHSGSTPVRTWAKSLRRSDEGAPKPDYGAVAWSVWANMVLAIGASALKGAILDIERRRPRPSSSAALLVSMVADAIDDPAQLAEWTAAGEASAEPEPARRRAAPPAVTPPPSSDREAERLAADYVAALSDAELEREWAGCIAATGIPATVAASIRSSPRSPRYVAIYLAPWLHRTGAAVVPGMTHAAPTEPGTHAPDYAALAAQRRAMEAAR